MVNIAVIGAGSHSTSSHGPALRLFTQRHPGRINLVAVCDTNLSRAETFARTFGFERTYGDIDRMLQREELDGIVAVTAIDQTATIAEQILAAGIPVLIEKPPGRTIEEATRLCRTAKRHRTGNMVSFNRRFNPAIVKARNWISELESNRKAELILARMLRDDRTEADFMMHTGIHLMDTVISLMGHPGQVHGKRINEGRGGGEIGELRMSFADGGEGLCVIAPTAGTVSETYEIIGTGFHLFVDVRSGSLVIHDHGELVEEWETEPDEPGVCRSGNYGELVSFVTAIENGGGYSPTLEDGLAAMSAISDAMKRSPSDLPRNAGN